MAAFKAMLYLLLLLSLIGSAGATTYTVGASGCDYTIIQDAVDAASSGDTVYVCNGSYTENVDIATAHLTIEGEGRDVVTVTAASNIDHVIDVTADYVNITGVKVTGANGVDGLENPQWAGVYLHSVSNCNVSYINSSDNYWGIALYYHCYNNTVINNNATDNGQGIHITISDDNIITNNTLNLNDADGIYVRGDNNTLTSNTANSNTYYGIFLYFANDNTITSNTVNSNNMGIYSESSYSGAFTSNTANFNTLYGVYLSNSEDNILTTHNSSSNTEYDYLAWRASINNTLLDCNLDGTTSMMNDSTSQWIIKYTTSNITDYSDTTINQTISPTNVTTTVEPTVDDYVVTMTTLNDFSASTDVSTATLQLAEFVSGGHSKFNVSSVLHAIVTTFNLGTFPPGQAVRLKRNKHGITCARANAAGIATFIYDGGYSDNEFETDPVGLYVYLNDTQNYTFTNDSYDAPAFTSQVTITSTGSPPCAVSVEMPLITDSTYTKLGYNVTNVTGGFSVTNASGWAAINFTVTNTTTIRISPSAGTKTSNLPATVVTGIGGVTVIVYLLRRRRR